MVLKTYIQLFMKKYSEGFGFEGFRTTIELAYDRQFKLMFDRFNKLNKLKDFLQFAER